MDLVDDAADTEMNWVIHLIEGIRSARAQMRVPAGLQIPIIYTERDDTAAQAWDRNATMIQKLARITELNKAEGLPKGCITIPAKGATFALPLEGIIDIDAEKTRLEKTLQKLAKEIGGLKGRLNNPKFVDSAPEEVITETRENLALREEEEAQLKDALRQL
jgi:valyl-tRNA synthetase